MTVLATVFTDGFDAAGAASAGALASGAAGGLPLDLDLSTDVSGSKNVPMLPLRVAGTFGIDCKWTVLD